MNAIERIGFIGVGTMGGHMCRNLAQKSGKPVTAFDTNAQAVAALADAGIAAATDVAGLVAAADLVIQCLPGEPQVREVCLGKGGILQHARAGQIIVDMTTATAEVAREVAAACTAKGIGFLDAPVARGVSSAADGSLSIMVGGDAALFDAVRPLLACMGTDITLCGAVGTGQVVKLMNNMLVFQNVSALAEAMAIGRRAGVDGRLLFDTLAHGSADSFVLRKHGQHMVSGAYPDDLFPITYSLKDLGYALQLAETVGVDAAGAKLVERRFHEAVARGLGHLYSPAVLKVIDEEPS